ncbi:hypothetical protein ABPG72_017583 [Tetrahymena utriculariae]
MVILNHKTLSKLETVFTIITMFVTSFFWVYALNRIGKIISNSEMKEKSYRQNMQIIHDFMRVESVDSGLRAKVSNYLQYYNKETNEVQKSQEHRIINQFSEQLKTDLMKEVKKNKTTLERSLSLQAPEEVLLFEQQTSVLSTRQKDRNSLISLSNYNIVKARCFSCNGQSHLISDCPRIHSTASKNILAVNAFQSTPHLSHEKFDRRSKKFNPLLFVDLCLSSAIRFFNDQMVSQSLESNQLDDYFINQEEFMDDIESNQNYFIIRNITKPLNSTRQIKLQIEDEIKGNSQNAINNNDIHQNQNQHCECSVVENINLNDDNSILKYNSYNFQVYLDNDQNPACDQANHKIKNYSFEVVKLNNNNEEVIQSAKLREHKQRQVIHPENDEQPIYISSSHEQLQLDQSKLQISSEDKIQLESDIKLTLFPVRQNYQTMRIPHNTKRQSLLKQISYKQDDRQQEKGLQNNGIKKINSHDCIQSCQAPFQKMESSINMQNSLSENANENWQSCGCISSLSNTSKTTKMNLFKQIKIKTFLALQIKKSQKPFLIHSQNTISRRKSVQLETQKFPSSIKISDGQGKLVQFIDHNKQECTSLEESIKKPVLDFQNLKKKSIKEDPAKKRINDLTDFSIPSSFEFKAEENVLQKKTNFYDYQTELLRLNQMKAIGQQNINFKTILPTAQDNNKLIQCLNQIEWDYLSLILFDKAKIFKYYYPLCNNTYVIQKINIIILNKKQELHIEYEMSQSKQNEESQNIKNLFQNSNSSKINFIERNESILDSFQEAFYHVRVKDQRQSSQEEYYDIPMRRGESVDMEQINENSQAQSFNNSQNVIQNRIQDNTSKKQVFAVVTKSKTSSDSKQSSLVSSHVEELNQDKVEQLKKLKSRIFSINSSLENQNKCLKSYLSLNGIILLKQLQNKIFSKFRIFKKLTEFQHHFINDKASFFSKISSLERFPQLLKIVDLLQAIKNQFTSCISKIPIFSPYSGVRLLWDCFIAFIIISLIFILSLVVFFGLREDMFQSYFQACQIIINLNILIQFNTGVIVRGKLIIDRIVILKQYFKHMFVLDQLGAIPLYIQASSSHLDHTYFSIFNFLILIKLHEFIIISKRVTYVLNYQKNMKNMIDLLRLVFIIGCVCHVFCLFWYGIAVYEINQGKNDTWLHAKGLVEEKSILIKYTYSFYFLSLTMITVGYGDITPQNPVEMTFTIITMFVTGFFWAYSLNRIGKIIQNSEKEDKAYRENMQVIHTFMREENVDSELRAKVSNYLKYYYKESNEVKKNQEQVIINQLSDQLKNDLMKNVRGKYLKDIPFITSLKSQNRLISIMKEMLFSPGEYIFHQDEVNDCSLFFLVKGEVEIIQETSQRQQEGQIIVKKLQKLSYFGEIAFITGGSRSSAARAIDFCVVYKMERLKFLEIIKDCNDDYETFCMIKEALLFKNSYNLIKTKCFSCGNSSHLIQECNKIHFTVTKKLIAAKAFRSTPIKQRVPLQRRNKKYSALNNIDYCLNDAYKILNDQIFSESLESSYLDDQTMEQLQMLKTTQKSSFLNSKKVQTFFDERKISINISDQLQQPQMQALCQEQSQKQLHDESSYNDQFTGSQGGSIINYSEKEKQSNHNSYFKQKSPISSDNLELRANTEENITNVQKSYQDIQKPSQEQHQQIDRNQSLLQRTIGLNNNKVLNTDDVVLIDVNQLNDLKPQIITQKQQQYQQQSNMKQQFSKNVPGNFSKRQTKQRITFKKDELLNRKSITSEDFIPSSELIQPIYVQNSNIASIKNFKSNTIEDSDIQETSDTETNNLKIKAQRYFQQVKCQNMVQKSQKCSFSHYQNSSSSQKKIHLPDQYIQIQSQLNILEDYNRQSNQISESSEKSNNQDSIRKQLFEQQINKYPTIDQQKQRRPERRNSSITQETTYQSFYPNQKNLEQIVVHSQIFQNEDFSHIQSQKQVKHSPGFNEQKQCKIVDFIQQFEWEFLEMHLFDKIQIFQYYYPTFNFNNVIKKIKQLQQPRRTIHSKRKIRACLINGQRRKPIFDKYGQGYQNIFKNI